MLKCVGAFFGGLAAAWVALIGFVFYVVVFEPERAAKQAYEKRLQETRDEQEALRVAQEFREAYWKRRDEERAAARRAARPT